ncbi:hypothetical protein ACO34A_26830 (plasmid) [Rhizobium sp. ACO-34A]|nr:hypothetical protein [Rhizobium sp. ACO-34A]ATN37385.1 hypothetical protein ACO34A_26830 [Rhizobium sp. ACO-34A]
MAEQEDAHDAAVRLFDAARRIFERVPSHEWFTCLGGNGLFWLLGATAAQFAVFDVLWLAVFWIRCLPTRETVSSNWNRRQSAGNRREFLVFLFQVLIACDAAAVVVDSFSSTAIV